MLLWCLRRIFIETIISKKNHWFSTPYFHLLKTENRLIYSRLKPIFHFSKILISFFIDFFFLRIIINIFFVGYHYHASRLLDLFTNGILDYVKFFDGFQSMFYYKLICNSEILNTNCFQDRMNIQFAHSWLAIKLIISRLEEFLIHQVQNRLWKDN